MHRHSLCMVPEFRADDRRFLRSTTSYDALGQKGRHRFVAANPQCVLCRAPSQVVDHDHVTGLIRGALCQDCNTLLGFIETLCDPTVKTRARTDPEYARGMWADTTDWVIRALEYTHHSSEPFEAAYGIQLHPTSRRGWRQRLPSIASLRSPARRTPRAATEAAHPVLQPPPASKNPDVER